MKFLFITAIAVSTLCFSPLAKGKSNHDYWYTMQVGDMPWGYIKEKIQETPAGLNCRVEIRRKEGNGQYQEFLSAVAKNDEHLTPKYFNLRRTNTVSGATEVIDGTHEEGVGMRITYSGARNETSPPRKISKGTILECYLPTWFKKNFKSLQPGKKTVIPVFGENVSTKNFFVTSARISVESNKTVRGIKCRSIRMSYQNVDSAWCVREDGVYEEMAIPKEKILIKRVAGEKEVLEFLPKAK